MKALILKEFNHFGYEEVPDPQVTENQVLVRVHSCGICGSDVHGMDGSTGRRRPPIIMGHEAAGVIEDVGKRVTDWKHGDRVTFDSTLYCGSCWFCRRGLINLCDNRRVLGVSCEDYKQQGAFAEYIIVPRHILYRIPDAVSFDRAAMVEAVSVAVHAVERTPVTLGDTAVVIGVGMIGLLAVQTLRIAGCGKIIVVDVDQEKLNLALKLGADVGLRANGCAVTEEVKAHTQGRGADIAMEVVGIGSTVKTAVSCLRKAGTLTLVGNLQPLTEFPLQEIVTRQIALNGSCASSGEYPACLDLMARGAINAEALISATPPLSEGEAWFKRLYNREAGLMKVILQP